MKNHTIKCIVFDLGNVLLPFDYNKAVDKLNVIETGLGEKFTNFYKNNYQIHRAFEKGKLSEKEFINKMLEGLDNKISSQFFCEIYSSVFKENKEVTALLPRLKENFKLILLSNTNSIHQEYGWKNYGFLKYFDKLILSHEVGAIKPEKEIYKCVENYTSLMPENHLFIDDIIEYTNAAENLGWNAIHFTGNDNLFGNLKNKGIL